MRKALVIWFFVAALVAMGCSSPPDSSDSFGSVGTLGDSNSWIEIRDWYDLDAVRDDMSGNYVLMTNLDSTSPGYTALAGPTANDGKGWEPIGTWSAPFGGSYDGQGYEIEDLYIDRPSEGSVGLFGCVREGLVENVSLVNVSVTGHTRVGSVVGYAYDASVSNSCSTGFLDGFERVGGLVGYNFRSIVSGSSSTTVVTGSRFVGGLVGYHAGWIDTGDDARVSASYAAGTVTGGSLVGGLVGQNYGAIVDSHSSGSASGSRVVGGLVGQNGGVIGSERASISDSYSMTTVDGNQTVGGLTGINWGGTISNSYYNYDEVLINGRSVITAGALCEEDFEQWLTNGKSLDINVRLFRDDGYYLISSVSDLRQLLVFGQDSSLRFRLDSDLDLASEPNFFIPYLAGEFDGNGHIISNLSFDYALVPNVGLFGFLARSGKVVEVGVENVDITGDYGVGGLVGFNWNASISDCHATGSVTGFRLVGGLVGWNLRYGATVTNSHFIGSVTGYWEVGGLVGDNRNIVANSYSHGSVTGTRTLGGLVGNALWPSSVSDSYSTAEVSGGSRAGGLVGYIGDDTTVSNCYSTGRVSGASDVGGLVGSAYRAGLVRNSFWDMETSGIEVSASGTGKTTAEMMGIRTFNDPLWSEGLDTAWDITGVADEAQRDTDYIWNIVDSETYPFLSWEPVPVALYDLTISSTDGGLVSEPGEGTYPYEDGTVVDLVAEADIGYQFVNWTGDVSTIDNVNSASTTITMNDDYSVIANFEPIAGVQTQCTQSATGTGEVCFTTSDGFIEDLEAMPAVPPGAPADIVFPHGMFSFKVTGLALGQTVTITVELPEPVPTGTRWWKEYMGAWYSVPVETIAPNVITITLTDGVFPGDTDGVADGTITDPGGPGYPVPSLTVGWEGSPVNKAAVVAPWIALLAAIAGASLVVLKRRRAQI